MTLTQLDLVQSDRQASQMKRDKTETEDSSLYHSSVPEIIHLLRELLLNGTLMPSLQQLRCLLLEASCPS